MPMVAASNAVAPPTQATVGAAAGCNSSIGKVRTKRYTPAVTMVAAWINAETGVGPSIASGNQT